MHTKILYLFTRTPLHVGAGASVGAIDQPIQRERHTGFPIIPASSLKGSFADQWPVTLRNAKQELVRVTSKKVGDKHEVDQIDPSGAAWLFGSDDAHVSFAGSLNFSEARVLAFPIRSARGSYAWITCPLMLQRAARDGVFGPEKLSEGSGETVKNPLRKLSLNFPEPTDETAVFQAKDTRDPAKGRLDLGGKVVLEEYCFSVAGTPYPAELAQAIANLVPNDTLFSNVAGRLVVLSNGIMSHFVSTACEVAQHVRIDDTTGTAAEGGLFNQENVPSDTLFYALHNATDSRVTVADYRFKKAGDALTAFEERIGEIGVIQLGGDATTGLGCCSIRVAGTV